MTANEQLLTKKTACNLVDYTPLMGWMGYMELCVTSLPRSRRR